jgi:hypothetical protein
MRSYKDCLIFYLNLFLSLTSLSSGSSAGPDFALSTSTTLFVWILSSVYGKFDCTDETVSLTLHWIFNRSSRLILLELLGTGTPPYLTEIMPSSLYSTSFRLTPYFSLISGFAVFSYGTSGGWTITAVIRCSLELKFSKASPLVRLTSSFGYSLAS